MMNEHNEIQLYDVVALTEPLPDHNLWRGEIGAVVERYDDAYEVEFVAQDGYTVALLTLNHKQIIPLRQRRNCLDGAAAPLAF